MVMRETDPVRSPFRRAAGAMLASLMVAAIALAGIGLFGLVSPGGKTSWRTEGAIVIERETGARYVYLAGLLHPVANYASALLLARSADARPVPVAAASISGVPRGKPLGIPGAPDTLPRLLPGAWTLCSRPAKEPQSIVYVGAGPPPGHPLGDNAIVVRGYLIWHGHRYAVRDPRLVLPALGFNDAPVEAAPAWLNALPAGQDLARITIPGRGGPSKAGNLRTGQVAVVETQGGGRQYHVAVADGLAAVTQVQADLLLGDPETPFASAGAVRIAPADYAVTPRAAPLTPEPGPAALPVETPKSVRPAADGALCAAFKDASGVPELSLDVPVTRSDDAPDTGGRSKDGTVLADRIVVEPGRGALVAALSAPGAPPGGLSLVTDLGVRYAIPNADVQAMLGYGSATPVRLPAGLVALLPAGRALDPDAALVPVVGTD
ncbi:type VII secretion protein EccB [Longispora fulva]|nr:type VII secretion protein EccB [Longispora fulva]